MARGANARDGHPGRRRFGEALCAGRRVVGAFLSVRGVVRPHDDVHFTVVFRARARRDLRPLGSRGGPDLQGFWDTELLPGRHIVAAMDSEF